MSKRLPAREATIAGHSVGLFADDDRAIGWLGDLTGKQETAAAHLPDESSAAGPPILSTQWQIPLADDPYFEAALEQYQRLLKDHEGGAAIPTLHPLPVGNVLLARTLQKLLAVDFASGKLLWEAPSSLSKQSPKPSLQEKYLIGCGVGQRTWDDLTYGALSSDGRRVFSVDDVQVDYGGIRVPVYQIVASDMNHFGVFASLRGAPGPEYFCNRLIARNVGSGKVEWELGGLGAARHADTFFLGPPLPLMDRLYVLADVKAELHLLALNPANGEVIWAQPVALPQLTITKDPMRRWSGASPIYADGILLCPTYSGAIAAYDPASRSFLWGYRYKENLSQTTINGVNYPRRRDRLGGGIVTLGQHRVILTPVDSESIYCLNASDGQLLWKCSRQPEDLYVACVDGDKVVVVGRGAVRAVRLADGKPAWDGNTVDLPNGGTPSGMGVLLKGKYLLPLTMGQVVAVDIAAGKIASVSKLHSGGLPGNLVCDQGTLISEGVEGIDCYLLAETARADIQRRLAANPNDAEALVVKGELLLETGKRSDAIASFRRAYDLQPAKRTRDLLASALLDGLKEDFAAYRSRSQDIWRSLVGASERTAFLRLMADGLWQAGEQGTALECFQKLLALNPNQPLDQIDKTLLVRRDRWVESRLAEMRETAKGEWRTRINVLAEHCDTGLWPAFFSTQPGAESTQSPRRPDWPLGNVETANAAVKDRSVPSMTDIELLGNPTAYFRSVTLRYDQARPTMQVGKQGIVMQQSGKDSRIVAYGGEGQQLWRLSPQEKGDLFGLQTPRPPHFARSVASANDEILLLPMGAILMAVDVPKTGPKAAVKVLWTADMADPTADYPERALPRLDISPPWQFGENRAGQAEDALHVFGPVSTHCVCFRRAGDLVAADPRNGKTLWVRRNIPRDCVVFGDSRYVLVLAAQRDEATLLRASNGELVGMRKMPPIADKRTGSCCLATVGTKVLLWRAEKTAASLRSSIPSRAANSWPARKFSAGLSPE